MTVTEIIRHLPPPWGDRFDHAFSIDTAEHWDRLHLSLCLATTDPSRPNYLNEFAALAEARKMCISAHRAILLRAAISE